ncbi:ImmA/IrrE family metallo-endopeptidase [Bariatricus sp. HCP28S3_D3]|uniref:ImmA/IrrE family metallo-endopeptidase n=1 Tax=Bariatricus sp. HCP28S3_D3 TaxID=3438901 RepID=UPI003F8B58EE
MDAVKTAEYTETKKLIKKYGTRDPFEIMDQMNIVVGETSRYKTLKGYCFMSCKTIYVMISSFLSEEEKMIVAAHELGHIILHRSQLKMAPMQDDTLYNMTDNTEYQANLFVADLLIEDEDIEEMVQNEVRLIICRWRYRVISWRNNKGLKHSAIRKLSIYLTEVEYLC